MQFIREKSDTFEIFKALCSRLQTEKCSNIGKIVHIRSEHGREFENAIFAEYCNKHGISREFSAPKTPEQNGGVERKNRTIQEMARVMLKAKCGESPSVPARKKKSRGARVFQHQIHSMGKQLLKRSLVVFALLGGESSHFLHRS